MVRDRAWRLALVVVAVAALAGCVSDAELRQQDEAQCTSYGFKPGTDAFAGCLQQENLGRRYRLEQYQAWPGPPYWWNMPVPPPTPPPR